MLLVSRSEALASPVCRNETTPKPTHRYINIHLCKRSQQWLSSIEVSDLYTPIGTSLLLLCLTFIWGTARFLNVKHKASSTPFLYIGSLPLFHPEVDFGKRTVAKLQHILKIKANFGKKEERKSSFHKSSFITYERTLVVSALSATTDKKRFGQNRIFQMELIQ